MNLAVLAFVVLLVPMQAPSVHTLSGFWVLEESAGDVPEQAVKAIDGAPLPLGLTVQIEQTSGAVTVRQPGAEPRTLRLLLVERQSVAPSQNAVLTSRAEWRDGVLIAAGEVTVKQGFLEKRLKFEERWEPAEDGGTIRVRLTLDTPKGTKRRVQVFRRAAEPASGAAAGAPKKFSTGSEFPFTAA